MAKSKVSDIVKITISTKNIPDIDPMTNQPTGTFRNILKDNTTDLRSFERVLQSAVDKSLYFREDLRKVDPNSGLSEQSVFIKRKDLENVYGTLRAKAALLSVKRGGEYAINVSSAEEIKVTKTIYGKDAQKKAIEELNKLEGKATVNASNPDKLDITLPYEQSTLAGMSQKQKSALVEKAIPYARKLSNTEKRIRGKEEEERRTANEVKLVKEQYLENVKAKKEAEKLIEKAEKEDEAEKKRKEREAKLEKKKEERRTANEVKLIKEQYLENVKAKKEAEKLIEKAEKEDEAEKKRKEREAKLEKKKEERRTANEVKLIKEQYLENVKAKKEAEKLIEKAEKEDEAEKKRKEREAKAEEKKDKAETRKAAAVTKSILAVVTIIGDIVRRILTASLKQASENNKMAVEAHSVGVTAAARRSYDIFDIAHGMEKGSTFGAIQSVQSMFGDITNLDEKALGTLARVMGSEVGELVRSGIGGQNPDTLLEKILDKYFKQFLSGKNSLGQTVGIEQARRELITSLQSVSPEIAKLFARMTDDYTSGYYGRFSNFEEWQATTKTNRTGLTEADQKFSTEIGKKYNEILAIIEDLKTAFFTKLAVSMDGLLTKVKNLRIGQSEDNKIDEDIKNRQKNEESKAIMKSQLKLFNNTTASKINVLSSLKNTPLNIGTDEAQASRFRYTAELLAGIQTGIYDEKYFKENISGTGMLSPKEAKAYVARGKAIADNAMFNPEVQDEIARAAVILQRIEKIDKANKNEIGSGKIADLSMTAAQQTQFAQEYAEKWGRSIAVRNIILKPLGSEQLKVGKEAYIDYLMNNPSVFQKELDSMSKEINDAYTQNLIQIAIEKGIKHPKEFTREDKIKAFAEANFNKWYFLNFNPQPYTRNKEGSEYTFLMKHAGIDARNNINKADSKLLSDLILQKVSLEPNTRYNTSGRQGESGEYVLKLQMLDSSGRGTGKPISLTLSDTKGKTGDIGTIITDSKGNIVYATTN